MLPGPDDLWVRDSRGRHASEFLVHLRNLPPRSPERANDDERSDLLAGALAEARLEALAAAKTLAPQVLTRPEAEHALASGRLALVVLVNRLAGTVSAVALLTILTSLPQIAIGLHAGVIVDRWDRRKLMIACDLVRAGLVLGIVFLQDARHLPWVYALAVVQAAASVFFEPARTAFLPAVVAAPTLLAANSFGQTTRIVCGTAGAALAGWLLSLTQGLRLVFALDAASFVISALALGTIRVPARAAAPEGAAHERRSGLTAELFEGLRLLFGNRTLVALLITFSITLLGMGAVSVLFVPFMLRDLGGSRVIIRYMRAAQTAGILVGGALLARGAARWTPTRVLTLGIAGLGPCLVLIGLAPHWLALMPLFALIGVCSSAIQAGSVTLLQHAVPDHVRGRAESTLDTLLAVSMLIAMAGAGVLGDRLGARTVFVAAGVLALMGGLVGRAWLSPRDRGVQRA
jgi:MFS family permease